MTIYVMTHKVITDDLPSNHYQKMLLGAYKYSMIPDNYATDDQGLNISKKNESYCELTGLYEIWKNHGDANVGLVHYRRFFTGRNFGSRFLMYMWILLRGSDNLKPVSEERLRTYLHDYDWVVPTPEIQLGINLWQYYCKYHYERDLVTMEQVVKKQSPEYYEAFRHIMLRQNKMIPFNMFYTSKQRLNDYCEWLFPILFEIERQTDISNYQGWQRRLYGYLAENLFNIWLYQHRNQLRLKYLSVYNTHLVSRQAILERFWKRGRVQ